MNYLEMDLDTDKGTDKRIGVVDGKPGSSAEVAEEREDLKSALFKIT